MPGMYTSDETEQYKQPSVHTGHRSRGRQASGQRTGPGRPRHIRVHHRGRNNGAKDSEAAEELCPAQPQQRARELGVRGGPGQLLPGARDLPPHLQRPSDSDIPTF